MQTKQMKIPIAIVFCLFLSLIWSVSGSETESTDSSSSQIKQQQDLRGSELVIISVNTTRPGEPLRHVWQYFGYDECNYSTTTAAQELMRTLADINTEPVYLRQHFLLASGDGKPLLKWGSTNVYTEDANGNAVYDWRIMDQIFDAVIASGCRHLVEIGFMPRDLSIKPEPYQGEDLLSRVGAGISYPPKDYDKWAELIRQWARHCLARYKNVEETWIWELWNEPNINYWRGTFEEYCKLYDYTEHALHEVIPKAILGAPHTVGAPPVLRRFLEHCSRGKNAVTGTKGTRLDYIGFHSKGQTRYIDGHPQMELRRNLSMIQRDFAIIAGFQEYRNTPVIIGECDPEGLAALSERIEPANGYRNGSTYAAYEVAMMKNILDLSARQNINLQGVVTWAFLFNGRDYFEGFRTLSTNGIGKPVLNAFKMLGMLRGTQIPLTSTGALGTDYILNRSVRERPDIDGLAVATSERAQILIWNYHDDMENVPPTAIKLVITAPTYASEKVRIIHYRIDDTHSNSYTRWIALGRPQEPSPEMLIDLIRAAELQFLEPITTREVHNGEVQLSFSLPRYGISLIEIYWRM